MTRVQVWGEIGPSFVYGANRAVNERTLVRMIDIIADAGADCVKVQLKSDGFYAGDDLTRPPHDPDRAPFKTRGEYVAHREPDRALLQLIDGECTARGLSWTASPWDAQSVALLAEFAPEHVKIASACLTDDELLIDVRQRMPAARVVLSTGMSSIDEIRTAVRTLDQMCTPREDITLAVCTAAYPAAPETLHLARIAEMRRAFPGCAIGWSSHSPDPTHAALAVAAGATWIETHVTTGRERWGPDHAASLDAAGFAACVRGIREAERVMGSGAIGVLPCEEAARKRLRRTA